MLIFFLIITLLQYLTRKDTMSQFTKQLVLMLLFLVVINAAPQPSAEGDLLLQTREMPW